MAGTQYRVAIQEHFSWQMPVKDMTHTAPPVAPAKGDRYIVKGIATGAWATHEGDIAWCSNATGPVWSFDTPLEGWQLHDNDTNKMYKFDGGAWVADDISTKADKVDSAVDGNLAGLDTDGNLTDSGLAGADVSAAVSASHTQGTDQYLDQGGANEVSAADAKTAVDRMAEYDADLGCLLFTI